jgi:hypothetical protein
MMYTHNPNGLAVAESGISPLGGLGDGAGGALVGEGGAMVGEGGAAVGEGGTAVGEEGGGAAVGAIPVQRHRFPGQNGGLKLQFMLHHASSTLAGSRDTQSSWAFPTLAMEAIMVEIVTKVRMLRSTFMPKSIQAGAVLRSDRKRLPA